MIYFVYLRNDANGGDHPAPFAVCSDPNKAIAEGRIVFGTEDPNKAFFVMEQLNGTDRPSEFFESEEPFDQFFARTASGVCAFWMISGSIVLGFILAALILRACLC